MSFFDGECRWRSAKELKWETIKAIAIPYNPDTFDQDVLISSIQDKGLNSLDLAQAIARQISQKSSKLSEEKIASMLNTVLARLRVRSQIDLVRGLEKKTLTEQKEIITQLKLSAEEELIVLEILNYQLNLFSVNNNKFPLLKLNLDIKTAIRERGLSETHAQILDRINPNNRTLDISPKVAKRIRTKLTEECLNNNWSKSLLQTKMRESIAKYLKDKDVPTKQVAERYLKQISQIEVQKISGDLREKIILCLEEKLEELKAININN